MAIFFSFDIDSAILAIAFEESWLIGNEIAAADDFLQRSQAALQAMDRARREGSSAGELGQGLQGMCTHCIHGVFTSQRVCDRIDIIARIHGVDDYFSALGSIDCLLRRSATGVILSIADDDENSGHRLSFGASGQFVGRKGEA